MASTVRISAGYSDKVSENYNSQQFSINLEMDAQINGTTSEIEQASDRLFQLCRKIVDHQKGVSVDTLLTDQRPQQQASFPVIPPISLPPQHPPQQAQHQQQPFDQPPTFNPHSGIGGHCSDKQVKCIFGIAKKRGMVNGAIQGLAQRFGKTRIEDLTSQEASALISDLQQ